MAEVGWKPAGIELSPDAAAKAARVTPHVFVGDPTEAPFPPSSFDLVTAFHVMEHLPDPLGTLRRMVGWLAPGGLIIVEVPNMAGVGSRLFGRYWSGLELPRHLIHFTPETMRAMVERAGGVIVAVQHKSKPRYFIRSLRSRLRDWNGPAARLGLAVLENRVGAGLLKLALELLLPLAEVAGRGEAARYFIRRRDDIPR